MIPAAKIRSKYVQWIGKDGGWKTGEVVIVDGAVVTRDLDGNDQRLWLIRHSCDGKQEFVDELILDSRPMRDEFEKG